MDEREKLFVEVSQGPASVRIEDLQKLMELWGFETRVSGKGDNYIFRHRIYRVMQSAARPHRGPVLRIYVKRCLQAIDEVRILEEESDG